MISMELQDKYFNYMLHGTKRIELRLFDEKRKKIKIGDLIKITNAINDEVFTVKVVGLLQYRTFEELFNDYSIEVLADKKMNKYDLLSELEKFYPREKQEQYNVLGIKIELI